MTWALRTASALAIVVSSAQLDRKTELTCRTGSASGLDCNSTGWFILFLAVCSALKQNLHCFLPAAKIWEQKRPCQVRKQIKFRLNECFWSPKNDGRFAGNFGLRTEGNQHLSPEMFWLLRANHHVNCPALVTIALPCICRSSQCQCFWMLFSSKVFRGSKVLGSRRCSDVPVPVSTIPSSVQSSVNKEMET